MNAIKTSQQDKGITLHPSSQTQSQTEELIPMFTGDNHISFPQWKHSALTSLSSSGVRKDFWHLTLLKKVGAPAKTKISQEAILEQSADMILRDLAAFYNGSFGIVKHFFRYTPGWVLFRTPS